MNMAGWGAFGSGLAQGFAQGIGPGLREHRWKKRKEEEEERRRKRAILMARAYGVPKDDKVISEIKEDILKSGKEAVDLYRHRLKEEKAAEAPFELQPLTEKGKPAGQKAPSYVTQQLIKETRKRDTRKKAAEELKGRQEQRQFGQAQGMKGQALEYFTSRPKITESQLGRLPGMPKKPPKPPDITADARAVYQGQQEAYTLSPQGQQELTKKAMDNLGLTPADMQPPVMDTTSTNLVRAGQVYKQQENAYKETMRRLNEEKNRIFKFEKANTKVDAILNNPRGTMAGDNKDLEAALEDLFRELLVEWDQLKREMRE
jgi:hypothetical protein